MSRKLNAGRSRDGNRGLGATGKARVTVGDGTQDRRFLERLGDEGRLLQMIRQFVWL
jgi:hypothetical protein